MLAGTETDVDSLPGTCLVSAVPERCHEPDHVFNRIAECVVQGRLGTKRRVAGVEFLETVLVG